MTACQTQFLSNLYGCIQNQTMVVNNFLWLVTNQSNGQAPADVTAFKAEACGKQRALVQCGVQFMQTLMSQQSPCTPQKQGQKDERQIVDGQFRALFGTLDNACADPCRATLTKELRDCYDSSGLDPELFLSNSTMGRGAVIGTTTSQVALFCKNRVSLVTCMKGKRDGCPEAPMVLRAIGLDIESMDKGVSILCKHQKDYLSGIPCFEEPTDKVVACQEVQGRAIMQLMSTAQQQTLDQNQYFEQFCQIRLKHMSCDLESWKEKTHQACNEKVIGLRSELECELLPDQCLTAQKDTVAQVCQVSNFKRSQRNKMSAASSVHFELFSLVAVMLGVLMI
ncbi:uncharacterized protein LOC121389814 [Gigantopelta aegis]|uniref:uncharacterized protein LOC121389814 n=1 Tax=Gigantopelta aegis TaxID=1735272 RepID=UPI001B889DDF|nr:uncharacterized protein LOC121389814 [Gigantopelta aegis]